MKNRLIVLGLHFGIFMSLMYAYERYITTIYAYEGYFYNPDEGNWPLVMGILLFVSLITPSSSEKPSTLFFQLLASCVIIPMLVLFYTENQPAEYLYQVLTAYTTCVFLTGIFRVSPPTFSFISQENLRLVLFVVASMYIVIVFLLGGAKYMNFDPTLVYEFRDDAANNLPGIFGYITPNVDKVVLPLGAVLSILYRKYLMAVIMLGFCIVVFGLTSHKGSMFSPFLILTIYYVAQSKNLPVRVNIAVLCLVLVSTLDFWMMENHDDAFFGWTGNLLMRRAFFVPAKINFLYHEFFSNNDWVWFSDSKLTLGMLDYRYILDVPHLIGREYFNDERVGANTAWFGSGYAQAGFFGLMLYAVIIAFIFKYIDACARKSGQRALVTAAVIVPVFSMLTSSDLPTVLFTHGLYLNLLLITCLQNPKTVGEKFPDTRRLKLWQRFPSSASKSSGELPTPR